MSKMFSSSSMKRLLTCSLNDKKIAKTLSPSMGFQLSLPPTGIGYNANLPHSQRNVKRSLTDRLHAKQEQLTQRDPGGRKLHSDPAGQSNTGTEDLILKQGKRADMEKGIDMSEDEAREFKKFLEEYRTARQRWMETLQLQGDPGISVRMMTDYSIIEQSVRSEIKHRRCR